MTAAAEHDDLCCIYNYREVGIGRLSGAFGEVDLGLCGASRYGVLPLHCRHYFEL